MGVARVWILGCQRTPLGLLTQFAVCSGLYKLGNIGLDLIGKVGASVDRLSVLGVDVAVLRGQIKYLCLVKKNPNNLKSMH